MKYSLKRLWKNLNFLMKYNLKEREENLKIDILDEVEDICHCKDFYGKGLDVLSCEETVDLLLKEPKSFCRFGDGEISLMKGQGIPYQRYDKKLAESMLNILRDDSSSIYVGLTYGYFAPSDNTHEFSKRWHRLNAKKCRDFFIEHCNHNRVYIDAAFNQMYATTKNYNFDGHYKKIKRLFEGKEVLIFVGKGVLDRITYDVFELAKSKEFIYGPNKNAFSELDILFEKAMQADKSKTLVFILGPCSKVLVHMLAKQGRVAYDVGHLAKDYDFYMNNVSKSESKLKDFYRPD